MSVIVLLPFDLVSLHLLYVPRHHLKLGFSLNCVLGVLDQINEINTALSVGNEQCKTQL